MCLFVDMSRFQTGGDFIPVHDEIADGATVIKWAKDQPWYATPYTLTPDP